MADEGSDAHGADIYALLELCTAEELVPIVDVLIKAPVSFLKFTRAFERHQPDHLRYVDQIGDETYRLGLLALGQTDGSRPTYQAMIVALCKQIGFPQGAGGPSGSEALLLNTFAKQHLSTVSTLERSRLVAEASTAAAAAASGVFSSDAWPPFASVMVHLAYLRGKLAEDGRLAQPSIPADLAVCPQVAIACPTLGNVVTLHLRGDELTLAPVTDPIRDDWRSVSETPKLSGALDPILKAIQSVMAASQTLRSDELLRRLPDGVQGTAHIVEAGTKGMKGLEAVAVSSLMGPMAVMMLAGAIAEQRKLEAIDKSLTEVKTAIADVSRFQQEERRSVLKGSIRYFQQVASSVLTGELAPEVLQEIERHEVDLVRMQEHLTTEVRTQIAGLRAIKKDTFGSGRYVKALQEGQAGVETKYDELLLCLRARACGYRLLCAFPGRDSGKRARLADITDAIDAISPTGDATVSMDTVLREKVALASSYDIKTAILGNENQLIDRIAAARADILESLESAKPEPADVVMPISIDLRIENGRAMAMRLA